MQRDSNKKQLKVDEVQAKQLKGGNGRLRFIQVLKTIYIRFSSSF